jgi:hypothetical protein
MATAGRKPVDGPKRNRAKPTHDWTLVADVPYDGDRPDLPKQTLVAGKRMGLLAQTKQWWDVVSTMPHCVLWGPGDWMFALGTVYVAEAVFRGDMTRANELRVREKQMGVTLDARRDLRIRYVDPEALEQEDDEPSSSGGARSGNVTRLEERRRRLTADAS